MVTPAGASDAEAVESAMRNIVERINSGSYTEAASLMTERFLQNFLAVEDRHDAPARMEAAGPIDVRLVGNPLRFADGQLSIDVEEIGFFTGTQQIHYARWVFKERGGGYKLNDFLNLVFTEAMLPGAEVIDVQLFNFAFALKGYMVPADTPILFRTTNNSSHEYLHTIDLVTLPAGTTAEQIIDGTINPFETVIDFAGGIDVESGATADLALESLSPGTYFLICPLLLPDGTRNYEHGMITEISAQ